MFDFFVFLSDRHDMRRNRIVNTYDIFVKAILIWSNVYYEL